MLEESILQREVENNFDVLRDKHSNSVTNLEKARIWKNVTSKINALEHTFLFIYEACRLKTPFDASEA
jgi:hypothetical protein